MSIFAGQGCFLLLGLSVFCATVGVFPGRGVRRCASHGAFLLTDPSLLDTATRMEFDRVLGGVGTHKTLYIRGGNSAVSPDVEKSLRGAGYTVVRYGGGD